MENIKTSFSFVDGVIFNYGVLTTDTGNLTFMQNVMTILQPTIEQNKISGKIELTILEDRANIVYLNIQPFEFTSVLVNLITSGSWNDVMLFRTGTS